MDIFGLLGIILVVVGVVWLVSGSLIGGVVLVVVGLVLAGGVHYNGRRL